MDLSVVVPAYREGAHIYENLQRLLSELDQLDLEYEVIVVSDGNTDATVVEAERVGSKRIHVIAYAQNMGKGYALTVGVQRSHGDLVTFIDADMELDPKEIGRFIEVMRTSECDIVVGSKRHPMSSVHYPALRRLQSWIYQVLVRLIFHLDVSDTQTGLKLLRRDVLLDVLPRLAVKRFAFDLELLVVAHRLGYRRIQEAPVQLQYRFSSTVGIRSVYQILWDTAAIFYRAYILRYYDRVNSLKAAYRPDAEGDALSQTSHELI